MEKLPTTDLERMREAMDSAQMRYEITTDQTFAPGARHDGEVSDLAEYVSLFLVPPKVTLQAATAIEIPALDIVHVYDASGRYLGSAGLGDEFRYLPRGESLVAST